MIVLVFLLLTTTFPTTLLFGGRLLATLAVLATALRRAPLPVVGLRMDIALTPKWFIRTGGQVFYIEFDNFTGSLLKFRAAVEYNPWKHVGLGLGFDSLSARLEVKDDTDWPGVDFKGKVDFNYTGLQAYVRLFF